MAVRQVSNEREAGSESPARRCFIAARPQTDIDVLRKILTERGIEATASYERPWLGARPLDTVMALIDDTDLVVGVLDEPTASANILFELGYAFARDKKIMVIQPRSIRSIPSDLVGALYVNADLVETEAIAYNLDALLAAPMPRRRPYIPREANTHPIGPLADGLLQRLSAAIQIHDGLELNRIVEDALRASGVSIVASAQERGRPDSGPDLGIWSDDLESSVGNPLLIEVKAQIPSIADARKLRQHVESYVRARNVEWSLVLYGDGPSHVGEILSDPPLVALRIGEMIERLRVEGLASIVGHLHSQAIRNGSG